MNIRAVFTLLLVQLPIATSTSLYGILSRYLQEVVINHGEGNNDTDTQAAVNYDGFDDDYDAREIVNHPHALEFKDTLRFGEPLTVNFRNPNNFRNPDKWEHVQTWIGLYQDTNRKLSKYTTPKESNLFAWLNVCNAQDDCGEEIMEGSVKFSAENPQSDWYSNFPYHPGDYLLCMTNEMRLPDASTHTHALVAPCQEVVVKPPPEKMEQKARVQSLASTVIRGADFTAYFETPVAVQNQWVGLYESVDGLQPTGNLACKALLWTYTGCANQRGDQTGYSACAARLKNGTITLNESNLVDDTGCKTETDRLVNRKSRPWPIKPGTYHLCVMFTSYEPFRLYTCSDPIEVERRRKRNEITGEEENDRPVNKGRGESAVRGYTKSNTGGGQ